MPHNPHNHHGHHGPAHHGTSGRHHDDSKPHSHDIPIPRPLLFGIFFMCGASILIAGLSRFTEPVDRIPADPEIALSIQFQDQEDGSLAVIGEKTGEEIFAFAANEGGFVRNAMRGLAYDRNKIGVGSEAPFHLMQAKEGAVFLVDPSTGNVVSLGAFGPRNQQQFAQLFDLEQAADASF
ncbi:MAG: photosynthetic complex assembly protein PuhC [Pseudomonadota bacterium]